MGMALNRLALNQLALNQLVSRQGPVPIWAE
jgi:hypothetical protein